MSGITSVGSTLAITASLPATQDAAGYAALVFTQVAGVETIPGFGPDTGVTAFTGIDGDTDKHKGATNWGSLAPPIAVDKTDAGQTLLRTAAEPGNNALYSFLVTFSNGDKRYSQGRVFGAPETVGCANNILMMTPKIELCRKVVKVNAA